MTKPRKKADTEAPERDQAGQGVPTQSYWWYDEEAQRRNATVAARRTTIVPSPDKKERGMPQHAPPSPDFRRNDYLDSSEITQSFTLASTSL